MATTRALHWIHDLATFAADLATAHLLLTRLTTLRCFRADAHAARLSHMDCDAFEADTSRPAAGSWAVLDPAVRTTFVSELAQLPN